MTEYVLLTDDDDGTALIACPDEDTAEKVGAAAVFNDGDVSAWRVPTHAITDWEKVRRILRQHGNCSEVLDADLPSAPREPGGALPYGLSVDEIQCALDTLAEITNDVEPDDLSDRQIEIRDRITTAWRESLGMGD